MGAPTKKNGKKSPSEQDEYTQKLKKAGAYCTLDPCASAANAIGDLNRNVNLNGEGITGIDVAALAVELNTQNKALFKGDLCTIEAMLLDQSHVLQALFVNFTQKLSHAEYLSHVEAYARIALRAQNQCRQTLATLGELKNPKRATFIKQQNNAVNQQINQDGKQVENLKKSENSANEILEELPHERLDTRTAQEAISTDQGVEAVEEGYRSKNNRREA